MNSNGWSNSTVCMPRLLLIAVAALSLAACATASAPPEGGPGIARLSPEELERLLPRPDPKLSTADLVALSKQGASAKDIIARIKQSGSRYALSASQAIELHAQGLSTEVLDYIQSAREQELRDRLAEEINRREQRHAEELRREQELRRNELYYDPWWPGHPGYGWSYGYPHRYFGGYYWRR